MKRLSMIIMCLLTIMVASMNANAQEITITLNPGWNWIGYTKSEVMDIATALGSFTPAQGDIIKSRSDGMITYSNGQWRGNLQQFTPGLGYHYYSNRAETVSLIFGIGVPQVIVTTADPTDITTTSAVCGGTVTLEMGNHVYARGVCWDAEPNPTIDDNHISLSAETGNFTDTLTELTPSTTYYVRAYAVTDYGLAYGEELNFATLPIGVIEGLFSISAFQQVYFSCGNLQYIGSANEPYWKFADHQWDYLGDNGQGSESQYVDRDLFGWGTSGYNHGAICYQPWCISENNVDYNPYGDSYTNLFDQTGQADWGYNAISNGGNQENQWRTLSYSEWNYLLDTRSTASGIRFAMAQVNNVNGVILLPDNWDEGIYQLSNPNLHGANYNSNIITASEWNSMEASGVVFLPVAGKRNGTTVGSVGSRSYYWTSTRGGEGGACGLLIEDGFIATGYSFRSSGYAVRLVSNMDASLAEIITLVPSNITYSTAIVGGNISDNVGIEIMECGICWSTEQNPIIEGNHITAESPAFGEFTIELTGLNPNTTYFVKAYAITENGLLYGNQVDFTTLDENIGDHNYVDLGLSSGLLWATCNVGANAPEEYGNYFAWGETQPKSTYNWSFYQYCNGSSNTLTKYCNNSSYGYNGFTDNLTTLLPEDDAARVNWGSDWRMPTQEEWQELYNNTTCTWTAQNGVSGWLFTANNGNSLFLPATGYRYNSGLYNSGNSGSYWSSSLYTDNSNYAWYFGFNTGSCFMDILNGRYYGRVVRAVRSVSQNTFIINVTVNPAEGGEVTGGGTYQEDIECTLTATPNEGYTFVNWTENDEVVSTNEIYTFTVNADRTLVANFTYNDGGNAPTGAIDGLFSVSATQQVYFSQGNLQYIGSAVTPYWKFADNQWDYFGTTTSQNSTSQSVDRDLFGWGTSGYHNANDPYNVYYQPWSTSSSQLGGYNYFGYGPSENMTDLNLTGTSANYDWGVYNPISNGGNATNFWRTLTRQEWRYVFNTRITTSGIRYAKAQVNDVNGVILLPDDWDTSTYSLSNTNTNNASFSSNIISATQWTTLEEAGAVFLPASGSRNGISVNSGSGGCYWSASFSGSGNSWYVAFNGSSLSAGNGSTLNYQGFSVRLVCVPSQSISFIINATADPVEGGEVIGGGIYQSGTECALTATANTGYTFVNWTENEEVVSTNATYAFTVNTGRTLVANFSYNGGSNVPIGGIDGKFTINSDGGQVFFSQGNLQYQASTDTWRFATNQYDYVGIDNSNISSSYNGWIDLFGWGTSGYNHGAVCYQPWSTSQTASDYSAYGSYTYNLDDQTGQADWGYNQISNGGNMANQWRTLTQPEWNYVFDTRSTISGIRYAKANVNDANGIILLPDDWSSDTYSLSNTNNGSANYNSNTITASQWATLESAGAVFLPAAGRRVGSSVYYEGSDGDYWSASCYSNIDAWLVVFSNWNLKTARRLERYLGRSVRLVRNVE